jgi:hypothetical protein
MGDIQFNGTPKEWDALVKRNKMKHTAVEWLVDKLVIFATEEEMNIIEQAKEMEKQQIIDAYQTSHISMMTAEQYYNETYKSEEL